MRSARRILVALGVLIPMLVPLLGGCGSASAPSPPTGVDELVIPTPSVDPRDFVGRIDNPWLPYRLGARWTYRVTAQDISGGQATMTVTVRPAAMTVDGVAATVVDTVGARADATDYYAQDRLGNVWWLGRQGVWQAGQDGAEAGLAMPAHPRNGDGWREGFRPGVVEDRAEIVSLDDSFTGLSGVKLHHVLDLVARSDLSPGIAQERSYVEGVGLVRTFAVLGPARLVELESGPS